jgi:hypothetical protein
MTVIRSASGTRIDCDSCDDYAAAPALSIEILQRATGYVRDDGRDFCPACWAQYTTSRLGPASGAPTDDRPAAA